MEAAEVQLPEFSCVLNLKEENTILGFHFSSFLKIRVSEDKDPKEFFNLEILHDANQIQRVNEFNSEFMRKEEIE